MVNFDKKIQNILQLTVATMFVFIAGLRYETGVDWRAYSDWFDKIPSLSEALRFHKLDEIFETLDVGYNLLNSIIKMIGGGIQVLFFVMSFFTTYLLVLNLRYYSKYVLSGLLIYYSFFFFVFDLSGIRQALAIQIILYSYKFISQNKFFKFFIYILIGTSIHWSCITILPLFFFINKPISKKNTLIIISLCFIIFTLQIQWLSTLMGSLLDQLILFTQLSKKIVAYTSNSYDYSRGWDLFSIYNFTRMILVVSFCLNFKETLQRNIKHFNILYNVVLLQLFCFFGLYEFAEISERLRFYFFISEVILISNIIYCYKFFIYKYIAFSVSVVIIFMNCYPYLLNNPGVVAYQPYQNYWIYSIFDLQSDGNERLEKHIEFHE